MTERRHTEPLPLGGRTGLPYSKGLMARALMVTGVPTFRAYELARRIEADLEATGADEVDLDRVHELAVDVLGRGQGEQTMRRLRRYGELQQLDQPVILLVGGATGTGKSTVATEAAHRLGITRVTSTDFVRQTMRAFFSKEFMPSIHYSSFDAGHAVADSETGDPTLLGFLDQTRNVLTGVKAAIERALEEGWSMVLEGVHLVPGMLPQQIEGALVVHCVLAIESEDRHAEPLHDPRRGLGRRPPDGEVPVVARRHPANPAVHRRAGAPERRPGDRERGHGAVRRHRHGARPRRGG